MALTKKERLEVYYELREYFSYSSERHYRTGFCAALSDLYIHDNRRRFIERYPELMSFKPKDFNVYWFPCCDRYIRLEVINKCIKILEDDQESDN